MYCIEYNSQLSIDQGSSELLPLTIYLILWIIINLVAFVRGFVCVYIGCGEYELYFSIY